MRCAPGWAHIEQILNKHSADFFVAAEVRHPSSTPHLVLAGAHAAFMLLRLALLAHRRGAVIWRTEPIVRQIAVIHRPDSLSATAEALVDLAVRDSERWVTANVRHRGDGLGYVEAALALDDAIWECAGPPPRPTMRGDS
jgi:hypothetical protein